MKKPKQRRGVVHLLRKGGAHKKSKSSKRQKAKRELKKELDSYKKGKDFDQLKIA